MTEGKRGPAALRWKDVPILSLTPLTPTVSSIVLRVDWPWSFRAGQHVDVRLTAPDGYQAQRSYSIASSPSRLPALELMIERLPDGEVSGFFHEAAMAGDTIELRGPIGGPFTWSPTEGGPLLLASGGSGLVPLLSMLRLRRDAGRSVPAVLLASARSPASLLAGDELLADAGADPLFVLRPHYTRDASGSGPGSHRRIDAAAVAEALQLLGGAVPRCFVCGSSGFVATVSDLLIDAGVPASRIRTERFG